MLTRDVRLAEREITALQSNAVRRMRELRRSIRRAEASAAAGVRIQQGTLGRHHDELAALRSAEEKLTVARKAIARQLAHAASKTEHVTRTPRDTGETGADSGRMR